MGVCSSCLGGDRRSRRKDSAETTRLLYDESQQAQYGAIGGGIPNAVAQVDPEDIAREEAALQKILARTSGYLMDIFALQLQPTRGQPPPSYFPTADAKIEHYQRLLQLISPEPAFKGALPPGVPPQEEPEWGPQLGDGADDLQRMSRHSSLNDRGPGAYDRSNGRPSADESSEIIAS